MLGFFNLSAVQSVAYQVQVNVAGGDRPWSMDMEREEYYIFCLVSGDIGKRFHGMVLMRNHKRLITYLLRYSH